MILNQKLVVVMPAYNAEKTLEQTYREISFEYVDQVILVDDASSDKTAKVAEKLGITSRVLSKNLGYGGNQKHCYELAMEHGAEIIVMLHPDYQYDPRLITAMAGMIASGVYDVVLGSRILCDNPLHGGMPFYKYFSNRALTFIQNLLVGAKLSEYHTGYRAFHRRIFDKIQLESNSNDFVFDNQFLCQVIYFGFRMGEISCPTKYFPEASSINFSRSIRYGLGVLGTSLLLVLQRCGLIHHPIFAAKKP